MTLSYEDAKELKDAGFPQEPESSNSTHVVHEQSLLRVPTLSELVEACGNGIGLFRVSASESNAWVKNTNGSGFGEAHAKICKGSTPEQAVKNLWIVLQKNV